MMTRNIGWLVRDDDELLRLVAETGADNVQLIANTLAFG
jgi:hypothetical protein